MLKLVQASEQLWRACFPGLRLLPCSWTASLHAADMTTDSNHSDFRGLFFPSFLAAAVVLSSGTAAPAGPAALAGASGPLELELLAEASAGPALEGLPFFAGAFGASMGAASGSSS